MDSIQSRLARPLLLKMRWQTGRKRRERKAVWPLESRAIIYGQKAGFPTPLTPRVLGGKERGSKSYQTGNQTPQSPHQPSYCAQEKSDRNYIRFRYLQRRCSSPVGMGQSQTSISIPVAAHGHLPTKFFTCRFLHTQSRATETNTFRSKLKTYARAVVTIL